MNAIEDGANNKLSELGGASNYSTTKALLQQRSSFIVTGELAGQLLPILKNIFDNHRPTHH